MMIQKNYILVILATLLLSATNLSGQNRQTRQEYIAKYKDIAIDHMERYGIPASITLAQGILESDCGNSRLSTMSNNHFGIKCKSNWTGQSVKFTDDAPDECFRAYKSVEESYRDHAEFLDGSPRYDSLFAYSSSDYKSWARGLKAAGYATASHYAATLVKIIEDEQLYILDRDNGGKLYANREKINRRNDTMQSSSSGAIDPNKFQVVIGTHKGYTIFRNNGLDHIVVKRGDTIKTIAKTFKISKGTLRKYNDLDRKSQIKEGDIIYLERKKRSWKGDEKRTHQTQKGETLHQISQRYGVRLDRLVRLNDIKDRDLIKVSQIIKLR